MSYSLPNIRQITESLGACAQLNVSDIEALAATGVKTLICNRPDYEDPEQPTSSSLQASAEKLGLEWHYLPVISGQVEVSQGEEFARILAKAKSPVVAFCRSGARCGMLWALGQRSHQDPQKIVNQLKEAGYDMPDFFEKLLS